MATVIEAVFAPASYWKKEKKGKDEKLITMILDFIARLYPLQVPHALMKRLQESCLPLSY